MIQFDIFRRKSYLVDLMRELCCVVNDLSAKKAKFDIILRVNFYKIEFEKIAYFL